MLAFVIMPVGKLSVSVLGFIGGGVTAVISILSIFSKLFSLDLVDAVITIYLVGFGICIVILNSTEVHEKIKISPTYRLKLFYWCKFLKRTWGRGLFYFFVGTLLITDFNLVNLITGAYMLLLGAYCLYAGHSTATKLAALKKQPEETLKKKFRSVANDGKIDVQGFKELAGKFDVNMNDVEASIAFEGFDENDSGSVSLEEFCSGLESLENEGLKGIAAKLSV